MLFFQVQHVRIHHILLDREKKKDVAKKLLLEMSYLRHYLQLRFTKKNKTIVYSSFVVYKYGTHSVYMPRLKGKTCIYKGDV